MLERSAKVIAERVGRDALVLDVGGGARPFPRADYVLDLLPYASRGQLGWNGERGDERFGPDSWIQRDICAREPWPFADHQFDFAVCAHTLEDVRDPIWVTAELQRVARAGYIEVPALVEELTYGIQGPWVGWGHHRWLVEVGEGTIEFLFKHHVVNRAGSHLPAGAVDGAQPEARAQTLWWEGSFEARERFIWDFRELDGFLEGFVSEAVRGSPAHRWRRLPFVSRIRRR